MSSEAAVFTGGVTVDLIAPVSVDGVDDVLRHSSLGMVSIFTHSVAALSFSVTL